MFTTLTIISSAILFKEWEQLTTKNIVGSLCGFATIVCGVFLLHAFKDINVTLNDLISLTSGRSQEGGVDSPRGDVTIILEDRVSQTQVWRNGNETEEGEESSSEEMREEDMSREKFINRTSNQ